MSEVRSLHRGDVPLLISVPHDGRNVPPDIRQRMTAAGEALPDTDWHVAELYGFARELGASMLVANYSRYVVDLNRPASDEALYNGQVSTGLCPVQTFSGEDIYRFGAPDDKEVAARIRAFWQPYHDCIELELRRMREQHGYALLWDAHSINSVVPRLFEGELPALNIGTNGGLSCGREIESRVSRIAMESPFEAVLNGRFQGGFITRHYGDPEKNVHAVQLEIAQRVYMDEVSDVTDPSKMARLRGTLRQMLESLIQEAEKLKV
jgi:N-formylglutamate amidohydrolase